MSQLRGALRRAGIGAAALVILASTATWLAPSVAADSPITRYVATTGEDSISAGVPNDCTDQAHPCATIWQAADYDNTDVKVAAGTYHENLQLCRSVTIEAEPGATVTVAGAGPSPTIEGFAGECPRPINITLQNLQITGDGTGAGVAAGGADITIIDSTVHGAGPGIDADDGSVNLQTSTVADNAQQGVLVTGGTATIVDSTIAGTTTAHTDQQDPAYDHSSSGGLVFDRGQESFARPAIEVADPGPALSVTGSIVASQDSGVPDCVGTVSDGGYNLSSDGKNSCGFSAAGDLARTDPKLGALTDNGGPTKTLLPLAGSRAIDAIGHGLGTCTDEHTTDQRGTGRPIGTGCDIGAVEAAAALPPVIVPPTPTCPPLVVDTTSLPDGTVGVPYSLQLQASGGCDNLYSWILPSDAPEGGFPPAGSQTAAPAGEQSADARPADQPVFTPTVHRSPVAAPSTQSASNDTPVNQPTGTPAGNAAPPGLSVNSSGVLSGTPTQAGDFTFTVSVNDPVLATLTLHVAAPVASSSPPPTPTPTPAGSSHGVGGVSTTAAPPVTATLPPGTGPLANTGTPIGPQLRLAIAFLVAGGALVLLGARRRRRPRQH